METRDSWWADGEADALMARAWRLVGVGGANRAEHLQI